MRLIQTATLLWCLLLTDAFAQQQRPLDHDVYGTWNAIESERISRDGNWVVYSIAPDEGDRTLVTRNLNTGLEHRTARGAGPRLTSDSRFVVFRIRPQFEALRQAARENRNQHEHPRDSLGILTLATGELEKIARVKAFQVPEEGPPIVVYHREKPPARPDTSDVDVETDADAGSNKNDSDGTELVLRNLNTGEARSFHHVTSYSLAEDGSRILFAAAPDTAAAYAGGVYTAETDAAEPQVIHRGEAKVAQLTVFRTGDSVAFLSNRDGREEDEPEFSLFAWTAGQDSALALANRETDGVPEGWWVSRHGQIEFSEDGRRLFFGTAPIPQTRGDIPDDEKVVLDIWNWQDDELQSMQVVQADRERERSFRAVLRMDNGQVAQLATRDVPVVTLGDRGNADFAVGAADLPYRRQRSWEFPSRSDFYLIDLRSGERDRIVSGAQGNASLSPTGRYVFWYENADSTWYIYDTQSRRTSDAGSGIPHPLSDELHDRPFDPFSYGSAGWTQGDRRFLIYDAYDVWAVDPADGSSPENLTRGVGRQDEVRFRYVRTDPDDRYIDPSEPILLSAFDTHTMASGFYRLTIADDGGPHRLIFSNHRYGTPRKAAEADVFLYTRESFLEFPDLWTSDTAFENRRKISDVNPQQSEYVWGSAELVEWISADGEQLRGIVHKPENFDPSREYPMMVYFYERVSETLHQHWAPIPHRSIINPTFYASRGYVVFKPDIPYRIGYPGESAYNAVVPGVLDVAAKGYVDRNRIGVMGHSWGGYQVAYLITRTSIFAAAHAGAPVSNMISAYGGIRWQTGMSRMFQYEQTQSRIGGTLWEYPLRYIENSPIFWAYKVETPLLMMHNDRDGAVPWEQGIEMFVALRRLGKPVWMLNYTQEPHWVLKRQNQLDFARRMQQFFDHYLMDAPMPIWMAEGIRAVDRGYESGFEYVEEPPTARE